MQLVDLKQVVPGLSEKAHLEKIKILGWWLHVYQSKASFTGADIKKCYDAMHFSLPSNFGPYLSHLRTQRQVLKVGSGYKLESKIRDKFDKAYGQSATTIAVTDLLVGLAATIPDMAEREYYKEALICYRNGSPRAAVVMTWNIAFSHLCDYVLANKLPDFNARWQFAHPATHKKQPLNIGSFDDFHEHFTEYQVLVICRDAKIITKNVFNDMDSGLKRRNAAAHPNSVVINQLQADAFIQNMIVNVVQKIK